MDPNSVQEGRTATRLPRPGWYPDPAGSSPFRFWDGSAWTVLVGRQGRCYLDRTATARSGGPADPLDAPDPATRQPDGPAARTTTPRGDSR